MSFSDQNFEDYLSYLRALVERPSPFQDPEAVKICIQYCKKVFEKNLKNHEIYFDAEHNLIAVPKNLDLTQPLLYLSAHIDTVDAKPEEWDAPYHPWQPYEDEKELVARGVNDCKAGVAFQLWVSQLISEMELSSNNLAFCISFKEEGAGKKTGQEIGRQLGKDLPMSQMETYFMVLENNLYVGERPTLCIYTKEKCNYVIRVQGALEALQAIVTRLPQWNPVSIQPACEFEVVETRNQRGGHICSMLPEENLLRELILKANADTCLAAGSEANFATIPSEIQLGTRAAEHTLVLNNRSFDSHSAVEAQLEGLDYTVVKDFEISGGFDIEEKFMKAPLAGMLTSALEGAEIDIQYTFNVGASDGTIVFGSMEENLKERFYPIVMGPGCRSQRNLEHPRLTHGKNETFDKVSGRKAVEFLLEVVRKF